MAQGQAGLVADDKIRVQGFGESSGAVVHCRAEPVCVLMVGRALSPGAEIPHPTGGTKPSV